MNLVYTITEAIAEREGTHASALPPLYESIDPESLTSFVASADDGSTTVRFEYCGYDVTVAGDGEVEVEDGDRTPRTDFR